MTSASRLVRFIAAGSVALAVSCGSGTPEGVNCRELLRQYALALTTTAKACDPGVSGSCSGVRTTASLDPQGIAFLCVDCETHVNPANVAHVDDLMAQYRAGACSFREQSC